MSRPPVQRARRKPNKPEVSVRAETHARIAERAKRDGKPVSVTLDEIVTAYLDAQESQS